MKLTTFLSVVFLSITLLSCEKDMEECIIVPEEIVTAQFSICLDNYSQGTVKSLENEMASKIYILEFYIFNNNDQRDMNSYYKFSNPEMENFTFNVEAGQNKTILVVANMSLGALGDLSYPEVKEKINEGNNANKNNAKPGTPMWGEMNGVSATLGDIENIQIPLSLPNAFTQN